MKSAANLESLTVSTRNSEKTQKVELDQTTLDSLTLIIHNT